MGSDTETISIDNLYRGICYCKSRVLQIHKRVWQHGLNHRRRRRFPHGRRERKGGNGHLLIVAESRYRDCTFNRCRRCTFNGIGCAPKPKIVQVVRLDFGPRIQDGERGGPVEFLLFYCGDY